MELIKIDPALRRKYRIRIYTGIAAFLAVLVGGTWVLDTFFKPKLANVYSEEELLENPDIQLFQEYIRIDTSPSTGSELAGAEFLARELEAVGIPAVIERLGENKANVWGILEGEEREAIVLHNHIDVYDVENPDDWNYPPFGAELDGVWLFGRGAFDMKSVTIAQLRALQALARSGVKPRKSVIFLATGGEETGSDLGTRWVLDKHPELVERFGLVLTEGGIVEPKSHDEIKYWGVEFAQKQFATLWACSESEERLGELRKDLAAWQAGSQIWTVSEEVELFSKAYAASRDNTYYQEMLRDPYKTTSDYETFATLPDYLKANFREELVAFNVEENSEGGYKMRIILHLLPGSELESLRARLLPDWLVHGIALSEEPTLGHNGGSPVDNPGFQQVLTTIREFYPDTLVGPHFVPWSATDSRFFREQGIPAYGFSPFNIFSTDTYRVDAVDERISAPGMLGGIELYSAVLKQLAD